MATRKRAPKAPEPNLPDLTVSAVVTVICTPDGGADIQIKVDCEGHEVLVAVMKAANDKLHIAGAGLRRVVMNALSLEQAGPTTDLLTSRRVGRA